ncbi:hypothetical protein FGO68_gene12375 [Halteria grandinella]|uniref:Protein kinase domain-containing protein n=1 Tax=Halteria grandinella TaxID=5974 RepID=A0A8J8P8Y0_HALGN|nr:hypothetical protein FGO68_gene12375 [Halteria grandinella]
MQYHSNFALNKNQQFRIELLQNACDAKEYFDNFCAEIVRKRVLQRQDFAQSEDSEVSQDKWVVYFQINPPDERQKILGVVQALHLCLSGPEVTCYQSSKLKNLLFQHSLPGCDFSLQETSTFKTLSIQQGPTKGENQNEGGNQRQQVYIVDADQNKTEESIEMKAILTIRITQEHKRVLYLRDIQIARKLLNSLQKGARYWDSMDPRDSLTRYQVATNDKRSLLGSGSFGKVYKAIDLKTQKVVALKKIPKKDMKQDQVLYIRQEIEILVALSEDNHQGVIQVYDVFEDSQYFSIAMECVTGGSLQEWIMNVQKPSQFNEDSAREMMRQVTESISYIHKRGIAHRDIKLENIMIAKFEDAQGGEKLVPKLVDFGLSGVFLGAERSLQTVGSVAFLSPEIVKTTPHTLNTDIWSIGIVFYISLTGRFPFIAQNVEQTMNNIENREPNFSQPCWQSVSAEAINLVFRMLCKVPNTRITAEEMLAHPWFSKKL